MSEVREKVKKIIVDHLGVDAAKSQMKQVLLMI